MRKFICILLAFLPLIAFSKEDRSKKEDNYNPKYLVGAVTLQEGKVVFEQTVNVPSLSKNEIYDKLKVWADKRFQDEKGMHSRVVYTDKADGQIAATAEEYIVFSSNAISLDRTRIYYQFAMFVTEGQFKMQMNRIRYWYDENRDGGERYNAEEWIIDDMALSKKKNKLAPVCGKFRRETIDLKDQLFKDAAQAVSIQDVVNDNNKPSVQATTVNVISAQPVVVQNTPTSTQPVAAKKELAEIKLNQLPSNLTDIAASGRITITAGEEEIEVKPEAWGGLGKLLNKDVTYTVIDKSRIAISLIMEHSDNYKISFYQKGETEPKVVIDCKKSMKQDLTADELKSLNQQVDANKKYTMYIGSITRCMMR